MAADAMTRAGAAPPRPRGRADVGLSIVVPLFNEAKNVAALHSRIVEVARRLKAARALATEVVYVDDGSRDATLAAARGESRRKSPASCGIFCRAPQLIRL